MSSSLDSTVLGQLVLSLEGDIIQSSGTLQNNENVSKVVMNSLAILRDYKPGNGFDKNFHRISFVYSDRAYIVAKTNQNIRIVQKRVTEAPSLADL